MNLNNTNGVPPSPNDQQSRQRIGKLRAALWAIEHSLDEAELRQAAHDALEADDDAHGVEGTK